MNLITVAIPIYNREKYIVNTLRTVLEQDCSDYEILLVDDGSKDNTVALIREEFAEEVGSGRIRLVLHEKNKGVSAARNTALASATTPYITFMDSDDTYFDKSLLSEVTRCLKEREPDCLFFKYVVDHGYIKIKKPYSSSRNEMTAAEAFADIMNGKNPIWHFVWNKVYKLSVVRDNSLQFPEHLRSSEDVFFNEEFLSVSRKVYFLDMYGYLYNCTNVNSLTASSVACKHTDADWVGYWNTTANNYRRLKSHAEALGCWDECRETLMKGLCKQLIVSSEHCEDKANVKKMHDSELADEVKHLAPKVKRELRKQKIINALRRIRRMFSHK